MPDPTGITEPIDDVSWFKRNIQAHEAQLKAYLRHRYPSVRDIDDVVQDSYLRIWKGKLFGQITSAKAFLFRVARNRAIDTLRADLRSLIDPVSDLDAVNVIDAKPNAADAAATQDELNLLLDAIESLPRRCREVVILRQLRGFTSAEIAAELGIAEGTVHIHGAKGARRCEEYLRAHGVKRGPA